MATTKSADAGRKTKWCVHCKANTPAATFRRHMRTRHPAIPSPRRRGARLHCSACNETFARSQKSRHIRTKHDDEKPAPGIIVDDPQTTTIEAKKAKRSRRKTEKPRQEVQKSKKEKIPLTAREYKALAKEANKRGCALLKELEHLDPRASERFCRERPVMLGLQYACLVPDATEYQANTPELLSPGRFDPEKQAYQLLICSDRQAHELLNTIGPPPVPVLIPRERNSQLSDPFTIDNLLNSLSTRRNVNIHVFSKDAPVKKNKKKKKKQENSPNPASAHPKPMSGKEAVATFRSADPMPCNLLDLVVSRPNPQAQFIAGLRDFQIMSDFPDDGQAGKPTTLRFADLTTSAAFQVCGKRGAFSHAHRDRHHVMTIVTSEEGEKIWNTFPPLNHAELCAWAESEDLSPPFRPMCCYLRPGDILIQPPGRLHAPLSLTDVLITGTMHLHPKTLVEAVQQSIVELHHPEVTNEEPAAEFSGKMSLIHASWMEKSGGYSWDTKERCNEFSRDLREYTKLLEGYG